MSVNPRDEGPAFRLVAITPNDSTDLIQHGLRALWVGGAGNVAIRALSDGSAVTIAGVPAGTLLPIAVARVLATGTTATNIVGLA